MSAGTLALTKKFSNPPEQNPSVQRYVLNWTADGSGNVTQDTSEPIEGVILRVVFNPVTGPTDNYDVVLSDEDGIDVLQGLGANRDTANSEQVIPVDATSGLPIAVSGILSLGITNAGASKLGQIILYVR